MVPTFLLALTASYAPNVLKLYSTADLHSLGEHADILDHISAWP